MSDETLVEQRYEQLLKPQAELLAGEFEAYEQVAGHLRELADELDARAREPDSEVITGP